MMKGFEMKTPNTGGEDAIMGDMVVISVGVLGEAPMYVCCFESGTVPETAYFPAGVPFVVSRRILRALLMDKKNYPITVIQDNNPDGANWFLEVCESVERKSVAGEWKKKNAGHDRFGVAAFIVGGGKQC